MALVRGSELPINPNVEKYAVAISWDKGADVVDVDLQAVIVDAKGTIIDAVYYNNLKAGKFCTHSGDELTGLPEGLDEVVWVYLKRVPDQVKLIIFVVAAFNRGHLKDVRNGRIHFLEGGKDNEVGRREMEKSGEEVDAVAMMVRDGTGEWSMRVIDRPAADGCHFMDILEPTIGGLIREVIPGAPKRQKVAFAMEKGAVMDLPDSTRLGSITARLGWDVSKAAGKSFDLDVSVVFFAAGGRGLGAVFFGNTEKFGVKHSGDNLTGEGAGDDEVINVSLTAIPQEVEQMIFCVNVYTKDAYFDQVSSAYCRVCDPSGAEMARYVLREAGSQSGLLISRLYREPGGQRWGFQAVGQLCRGRTWQDALVDMQPLCGKSPRELQLPGHGAGPAASSAAAAAAGPLVAIGEDKTAICSGCSLQ